MAMSTVRHVKAKTTWKNVEVPQQLMDDELFHGLIDVQELTDYELVSETLDNVTVKSSVKGKKRKKSDVTESSSLSTETGKIVDLSIEPPKKKRKKKKKKGLNNPNVSCESDVIENTGCDEILASANGATINGVVNKNDEGSENDSGKAKKKRKKKKKTNPSQKTPSVTINSKDTETDVADSDKDMSQWKNLFVPDELLHSLRDQGFVNPTEIQISALPSAIRDRKDILGAAETGSGKTLAFGIPVLAQILYLQKKLEMERNENNSDDCDENEEVQNNSKSKSGPVALILEPTRELAVQVKKHLTRLATHTNIRLATVVGGMAVEKQYRVLKQAPEVIIATPGRLWQLIEEGEGHLSQVDKVHSLVLDEADRMVEKGHYEELTKILHFINESPRRIKKRQTYVMSATLTMEIGLSYRVKNKVKKKGKTTDDGKLKLLTETFCIGTKPKVIDLTTKDKVAKTLTELRINCPIDEKDFYLYYFLCEHPGRTLVFVNSKDCLRRLASLFSLLQCKPLPLHADMHQTQRLKNLDRFTAESQSLLLASDVAARGLDIPRVDHVIHYQVPHTIENYVHRSGRTARASSHGLTVMLVGAEDARNYRKIVQAVKNGKEVPIMPIDIDLLPAVKERVALARTIDVKEHRAKKKRMHNNFFQKAAQEMDMILDDDRLLLDLGDSVERSEEKQGLKAMKQQLGALLGRSLAPFHMTKYPTKSGSLVSKKVIDLYDV